MEMSRPYRVGDRVVLSRTSPIDPEGVGPLPGDTGRVVSLPSRSEARPCVGVTFDRVRSAWLIPVSYLEAPRQRG